MSMNKLVHLKLFSAFIIPMLINCNGLYNILIVK